MGLKAPLFDLFGRGISWRDLILIGGGLFLLAKASTEIYHAMEPAHGEHHADGPPRATAALGFIMVQIVFLDIVFSLDSVITAVGMVQHVAIMAMAMIIAVIVMLVFSGPVGDFVESRPSVKVLALSFLVLIGVLLLAEGFGRHVPKGYVYFAMVFSLFVEMINLQRQARQHRLWVVHEAEVKAARQRVAI
jgi:predicted tellurium resistance membrane protein TerC